MKNVFVCAALALLVITLTSQRSFAQTAEELYQKGIQLEEVKGELEKAIESFKTVVEKFPTNKPLAAKALLHIGRCYEKLGRTEAQKAYERVIKEFADQREAVKEARARLIALGNGRKPEEKPAMTTHRIWEGPDVDFSGAVSRDGNYISYTDSKTYDLAVRELATGTKRNLTHNKPGSDYVYNSIFSADSKQLAYTFAHDWEIELRLINFDGSNARTLSRNKFPYPQYIQPADWSQDGNHILALVSGADGTNQIVLMSVSDGAMRTLKSLDWRYPEKMSFSPDGRYIAYDFPQRDDSKDRDIFLLATDGSRETRLIDHPANDYVLGWTPDGKRLLFASNRTGSVGAWVIQVADGQPLGQPELVKQDIGPIRSVGLTKSGSFFYGQYTAMTNVYLANLDPTTHKVISVPAPLSQPFVVANFAPDWSPDGKSLAYRSDRISAFAGPRSPIISIQSVDTGEVRELSPAMRGFGLIKWSPDGRSFLLVGADNKNRGGIHIVDAQTGNITATVPDGYWGSWSRDAKAIYYAKNDASTQSRPLVVRDLKSGEDKVLFRGHVGLSVAVSPDGEQIAFSSFSGDQYQLATLHVLSPKEGKPREIFRLQSPEHFGAIAWSPDGDRLLFTRRNFQEEKFEVWQIRVEGGQPQNLGLSTTAMSPISLHPDGKRVAFSSGGRKAEVWAMENFLPKEEREPALTVRKVSPPEGYVDIMGAPSPDGRFLTFVDWTTGDLAVYEPATGKYHHVTNKGAWSESSEHAEFSIASPDGEKIAYTWANKDGVYDLRVIGSDGSNPHVLYRNEEVGYFKPYDWSADGKQILTLLFRKDNTNQIALISAADGSARILKSLGWSFPWKMNLSPDGRYIVYDFSQKSDSRERDIFILAADGSREIPLVEHPADDMVLGWTPNGKWVLFASDRTGAMSAWAIRVADGKPHGTPEMIKSDIGRVFPLGFTRNGNFYYGLLTGMQDVYTATLDPATGKVVVPPTAITQRFVGSTTDPVWSPDGKFIAYILRPIVNFGFSPSTLVIRSLESGNEREISPAMAYLNRPRWSPDGRFILVNGKDKKGRDGIYQIDVQTGNVSPVITGQVNQALWSLNGKAIFYVSQEQATRGTILLVRDLATNEDRELYRTVDQEEIGNLIISLDAKQLAFYLSGPKRPTRLMVMPTAGGSARELLQFKNPERIPTGHHGVVEWISGGRRIIFVKRGTGKMELWRISVEGGEPQNLGIEMEFMHGLRAHPDGKRIAFAAGNLNSEVWVMENFLPKEERAQQ